MSVAVIPRPDAAYDPRGASIKPVLRLQLIGQMQALTMTGVSVLPPGRKTRALLAIVALSAPLAVPRTRLAELLWSRRTDAQARASARQELHRLSEALVPLSRPVLRVTRDQVALYPGLVLTDLAALLAGDFDGDVALLSPEHRLLEGLDGVDPAFDAWLNRQREQTTASLCRFIEASLSREAQPDATVELAERLLRLDQTHEGAWRALMRGYAARGERGLAIHAYERCSQALRSLANVAPSAETEAVLAEVRGVHEATATAGSRCARPRLRVLPFRAVGLVEPELANTVAEEVTFALAPCGSFAVVGSDALAARGVETRNGPTSARDVGADFVLSGTLQRVADRLRLLVRLLDIRDGDHVIWTHRFDHPATDVLRLQENAASVAAAELDVAVLLAEAERASRAPSAGEPPMGLVRRATFLTLRLQPQAFEQARALFDEALTKAPECAAVHAAYALWHALLSLQYWEQEGTGARAAQLSERALALDPTNARALAIAGFVRDALDREPCRALARLDKALGINRNLAFAWALSSIAHAHLGELDEAARRFDRYKELAPFHPLAFFLDASSILSSLLRDDPAHAVTLGRRASEIYPGSTALLVPYLAALGELGRKEEARYVLGRLRAIAPRFSIARCRAKTPLASPADRERLLTGLRLAGAPETGA